ncbi:NADH dehydrogenase [ubiquinone] iron-sulfur protein 1, mitochondrial [Tanacetum coccineum]
MVVKPPPHLTPSLATTNVCGGVQQQLTPQPTDFNGNTKSLRASQDEFTKIENVTKNDNFVAEICNDKLRESEMVSERVKRRRGEVVHVSWHDALVVVGEVIHQVKPEEIVRVAGNGKNTNAYLRSGYLLNSSIQGLEKADCFLLVGTQPRVEATMVNAIIRKTVRASQAKVGYIYAPANFK